MVQKAYAFKLSCKTLPFAWNLVELHFYWYETARIHFYVYLSDKLFLIIDICLA